METVKVTDNGDVLCNNCFHDPINACAEVVSTELGECDFCKYTHDDFLEVDMERFALSEEDFNSMSIFSIL